MATPVPKPPKKKRVTQMVVDYVSRVPMGAAYGSSHAVIQHAADAVEIRPVAQDLADEVSEVQARQYAATIFDGLLETVDEATSGAEVMTAINDAADALRSIFLGVFPDTDEDDAPMQPTATAQQQQENDMPLNIDGPKDEWGTPQGDPAKALAQMVLGNGAVSTNATGYTLQTGVSTTPVVQQKSPPGDQQEKPQPQSPAGDPVPQPTTAPTEQQPGQQPQTTATNPEAGDGAQVAQGIDPAHAPLIQALQSIIAPMVQEVQTLRAEVDSLRRTQPAPASRQPDVEVLAQALRQASQPPQQQWSSVPFPGIPNRR